MNPNYSEFKFPQIKAEDFKGIFKKKNSPQHLQAIDLISNLLKYNPE
jgi:glycogen synthase kinase 3 beta